MAENDGRFAFLRGGPKVTRRSLIKGGAARAVTAGVRTEAAAAPALTEEELEARAVGHEMFHHGQGRFGIEDIGEFAPDIPEHLHNKVREGFKAALKKHGPHFTPPDPETIARGYRIDTFKKPD